MDTNPKSQLSSLNLNIDECEAMFYADRSRKDLTI